MPPFVTVKAHSELFCITSNLTTCVKKLDVSRAVGVFGLVSNRAADGVEAGGVGRDEAIQGFKCLCLVGAWGLWEHECRRIPPRSSGELTGNGKTAG